MGDTHRFFGPLCFQSVSIVSHIFHPIPKMMLVRNARLKTIENPLLPIEKSLKIHLTPIGKSIEDPKSIGKPCFVNAWRPPRLPLMEQNSSCLLIVVPWRVYLKCIYSLWLWHIYIYIYNLCVYIYIYIAIIYSRYIYNIYIYIVYIVYMINGDTPWSLNGLFHGKSKHKMDDFGAPLWIGKP